MNPIKEIEIGGKKYYYKVSRIFKTPRFVYPIKTDGKWNYKNMWIGSVKNLIMLLIYVGIAAAIWFGLHVIIAQCNYYIAHPCDMCYGINSSLNITLPR